MVHGADAAPGPGRRYLDRRGDAPNDSAEGTVKEPRNRHLLAADLDMLLTAAVREADDLPEADVERVTDRLRALVRPAWLLVPHDGPVRTGGSRIGGRPDLPHGWDWPTGGRDGAGPAALAFLAQIDLADVPCAADAGWLPPHGRLWFFRNESGVIETEPDHVVMHADVPAGGLRPAAPPAGLDHLIDEGGCGPEPDRPQPVVLRRTLFLDDDYKYGWHSRGIEAVAAELDEHVEDGAWEFFAQVQRNLVRAALNEGEQWGGMLIGRPNPCPPPGGACPCGRSAPAHTPGYDNEDGPCSPASDSLLVLYEGWGDGPLVFTADATAPAAVHGRSSPGTEAWVY